MKNNLDIEAHVNRFKLVEYTDDDRVGKIYDAKLQ